MWKIERMMCRESGGIGRHSMTDEGTLSASGCEAEGFKEPGHTRGMIRVELVYTSTGETSF